MTYIIIKLYQYYFYMHILFDIIECCVVLHFACTYKSLAAA